MNNEIEKEVNLREKIEQREQRLNQATYELSDEILEVKDKLDKAQLILSEMLSEYFNKFNTGNIEDHLGILWEFTRNQTLANIIDDYVSDAKDILDELKAKAEKAQKENKKNVAWNNKSISL